MQYFFLKYLLSMKKTRYSSQQFYDRSKRELNQKPHSDNDHHWSSHDYERHQQKLSMKDKHEYEINGYSDSVDTDEIRLCRKPHDMHQSLPFLPR